MIDSASGKLKNMINEGYALKADEGKCTSNAEGGIVFVRLLTSGCWAFTADHRVYHIHRRQSCRVPLRVQPHGVRIFDYHDPWSPDKGIA